jgi:hypothetical protein
MSYYIRVKDGMQGNCYLLYYQLMNNLNQRFILLYMWSLNLKAPPNLDVGLVDWLDDALKVIVDQLLGEELGLF